MAAVEAVVVGAGLRGQMVYGGYATGHPDRLRIVGVAEPDPKRRESMAREHGIPAEAVCSDWTELLGQPQRAPVAIVATSDTLHVEPALAALERGYHVLLEKPIAPNPGDCLRVVEAAERAGRVLQISHVLRYTPFYQRVHEIVSSGRLGSVLHLDLKEHVAYWHMTHSFVRGRFRNRDVAAPIILAKSCHDLDLLTWLVDAPAERVASFGGVQHFRPESAPAEVPRRCTDGCPIQESCPHDAVAFYLGPEDELARIWPWSDVSTDPSREARRRGLEDGDYGRCVHHCDNDAPDHQVLAVEFEGGVTASFTVQGLGSHEERTIRVTGSCGELRGLLGQGLIEVSQHGEFGTERIELGGSALGHYGGDEGLLDHFTEILARGALDQVRASGRSALAGHLLGFAAEEARVYGDVVELDEFNASLQEAAP